MSAARAQMRDFEDTDDPCLCYAADGTGHDLYYGGETRGAGGRWSGFGNVSEQRLTAAMASDTTLNARCCCGWRGAESKSAHLVIAEAQAHKAGDPLDLLDVLAMGGDS